MRTAVLLLIFLPLARSDGLCQTLCGRWYGRWLCQWCESRPKQNEISVEDNAEIRSLAKENDRLREEIRELKDIHQKLITAPPSDVVTPCTCPECPQCDDTSSELDECIHSRSEHALNHRRCSMNTNDLLFRATMYQKICFLLVSLMLGFIITLGCTCNCK